MGLMWQDRFGARRWTDDKRRGLILTSFMRIVEDAIDDSTNYTLVELNRTMALVSALLVLTEKHSKSDCGTERATPQQAGYRSARTSVRFREPSEKETA